MLEATTPSIGVVIPARDAARYLGQAIDSALGQSLRAAEVVVVDDGSIDDTAQLAAAFGDPVRVISQPPSGPAVARNTGIRALTTDLVALLDADDIWPADSLQIRFAELIADPLAELCFGHMVQFVSPELAQEEHARIRLDPDPQPALSSSAMLARRSVFERVGPLPEHRRAGDFLEWLISARAAGVRWVMAADVVLRRRIHLHNMSRREPEANAQYLAIVRAELARRRLSGEA